MKSNIFTFVFDMISICIWGLILQIWIIFLLFKFRLPTIHGEEMKSREFHVS